MSINCCKVCGSSIFEDRAAKLINYVTSDSQSTEFKPVILRCNTCGLLQKKTDEEFVRFTSTLYSAYRIFEQSSENDQKIFGHNGEPHSRTSLIGRRVGSLLDKKRTGKLAEVGCGYGQFLAEFSTRKPEWSLTGFDLSENYASSVSKIKNSKYICGDFTKHEEKYDVIVGVHLLEHLYEPESFLHHCAQMVEPDGLIIFEVPNVKTSLFDLVIADHVCHFAAEHIQILAARAGLEVVEIDENFISKELFIVLKRSKDINPTKFNCSPCLRNGEKNIDFLHQFEKLVGSIESQFYIFGSSIAATWILQLKRELSISFLDQDVQRIGRWHEGLEIQSVDKIQTGTTVVMPFSADALAVIMNGLPKVGAEFIHPSLLRKPITQNSTC